MIRKPLSSRINSLGKAEVEALCSGGPTPDIAATAPRPANTRMEGSNAQFNIDDVRYWQELQLAGVRFPRRGARLCPPWHARHDLLPTNFEQPDQAEKEDHTRCQWLRQHGSPQALALAEKLEGRPGLLPAITMASSRAFRFQRVAFLVGALQLLESMAQGQQLGFVTLVPSAFFVEVGCLDPVEHAALKWKSRFRKHLNDAGMSRCEGFILGGLQADFEQDAAYAHVGYQFHYHLIYNEAASGVIEGVRKRPGYQASKWVIRPSLDEAVYSPAGILTYLMKSHWLNRARRGLSAPASLVRNGSRLAPAQMTECLAWFDAQRFADLLFTHRFNLPAFAKKSGW